MDPHAEAAGYVERGEPIPPDVWQRIHLEQSRQTSTLITAASVALILLLLKLLV